MTGRGDGALDSSDKGRQLFILSVELLGHSASGEKRFDVFPIFRVPGLGKCVVEVRLLLGKFPKIIHTWAAHTTRNAATDQANKVSIHDSLAEALDNTFPNLVLR